MAVATEQFLYVHMPKTGGQWVSAVLKAAGGIEIPGVSRHAFAGDIPRTWVDGRLMFGTVRDPWSWYVSLWRHLSVDRAGQMLLRHLGQGDQSFDAFLRGATDPSVWCQTPDRYTHGWWDWPVGGDGLWTETFRSVYGHNQPIPSVLIDTAQLTTGLSEILGVDVSRVPRQNTAEARVKTKLPDPRTLYDEDLVQIVREYDGLLAHRLGYGGPFQRLPRAVRWGGLDDE